MSKSDAIDVVSYDPRTRTLGVGFTNGSTYEYGNVPADVAEDFVSAPSLGQTFNRAIRGKYQTTKV